MGFSAERTVVQLCRFGFAHDLIASRFPNVDRSVFVEKSERRNETRGRESQRGQGPTPAQLLLEPIVHRARPTLPRPAVSPTPPPAPVVEESAGGDSISFQYVPLIQCSFPHADPGEVTTFTRRN